MLLHGYVGECEKYNGEYEKHTHTPQRIQHRTENVHRMHTMDMVYICVASKVLLPESLKNLRFSISSLESVLHLDKK